MVSRNTLTARELAQMWQQDAYTTSGRYWRISCPAPEHPGDGSMGNCAVFDTDNGVRGMCFSHGCSSKSIVAKLRKHAAWRRQMHKHPKRTLGREGWYCRGCNLSFLPRKLQVDHITPRSKGGASEPENYTLLCQRCNSLKGDTMTLLELQDWLIQHGIEGA